MEHDLIIKIPVSGFRPYIQSMRNCNNIGNGLVLFPKTGNLTLDFSDTEAKSCTINFKQDGGNGLILSTVGSSNNEHQITSRTSQSITFNIETDKIIRFNRTARARGNVIILDISLFGDKLQSNWNSELKKSKEHGCLRLVGDKLFASEGAFIKGIGITIKTEPPNVCTINGEGIKFTSPCQVLKLNIPNQIEELNKKKNESQIIFDTNNSGFNKAYCNNFASLLSNNLILDNKGSYTVPVQSIISGKKYAVHISISRLDGNGKVIFGLIPDNNVSMFGTVVGLSSNDFVLYTTPSIINQGYSVSVWRHPSSTGKLKIDRIFIEQTDVDEVSEIPLNKQNHFTLNRNYLKSINPDDVYKAVESIGSPVFEINDVVKKYEALSKYFAIFPIPITQPGFLDISGKVNAYGFKARQWLYRVQTIIPNIVQDPKSDILICDTDCVIASPRVWINEFYGDKKERLSVLRESKTIYTPSLENKIMLKTWFPNADVILCDLPLPKILDKQSEDDYYFYVEDNVEYTKHLLNILNNKQILCMVGTKHKIPYGMKYLSDYTDYSIISDYLSRSKGLISLTTNTNFKSQFIELALSMGIPVITNNTKYIGKASVIRHTESSMVSSVLFNDGLSRMIQPIQNPNHNNNVIDSLKILGVV